MDPIVDVTIPVHTRSRPIARAVSSIVDHTKTPTRVTVVAHNIDANIIRSNLGSLALDQRVRLLELADGIPSPAGPMNLGISQSTAPFISVMGSDDEFEPGAIDSWYSLQQATDASVIITQVRHSRGGRELSPPARPGRSRHMDPVKDRLSYRSAPLGLISRDVFGDLRFAEGLPSGEDLLYVTRLWFSGAGIAFSRRGPGYLVHSDAEDRVTSTPRSIVSDFAFLDHIFGDPLIEAFDSRQRTALAIKLIRVHLFDAIVNRSVLEAWPSGEREALATVARRMIAWADRPERFLSVLDRTLLDGILDGAEPVELLMDLIRRRWNYRSADVVIPRNPFLALTRQSPLRTYIGGYFV